MHLVGLHPPAAGPAEDHPSEDVDLFGVARATVGLAAAALAAFALRGSEQLGFDQRLVDHRAGGDPLRLVGPFLATHVAAADVVGIAQHLSASGASPDLVAAVARVAQDRPHAH